jgi:murein tripeptide amidase MpaA
MITLSNMSKKTEELEPLIEGLFPDQKAETRPFIFDKPTVFISCRVHPGETPASYVLDGIMKFLSLESDQSKKLLDRFVFKIVPMLNPDGVFRGYFRLDTLAQNLNRYYTNPDPIQ